LEDGEEVKVIGSDEDGVPEIINEEILTTNNIKEGAEESIVENKEENKKEAKEEK